MVPPDVLRQLRAFAERVERRSPGAVEGLYAVGSVALGDFRRPLSNLDLVAVSEESWAAPALDAVRASIDVLGRAGRPARVACITWEQLASEPEGVAAPGYLGRKPLPPGELVNPLTWAVLRTSAVSVVGPEYPTVGSGDLRRWAADRLSDWWGPWLRQARSRPVLYLRRWECERVLEVSRLAQVVRSGRVVSKVEAGELEAMSATPRFQRILKDSVGYRRGVRMSMYWAPFERRNHAIAYLSEQTTSAAEA